jgi:FkbM family methyltransferase
VLLQVKEMVRSSLRSCAGALAGTKVGRALAEGFLDGAMASTHKVVHGGTSLVFATPNGVNHLRAQTFSTKEPETLRWIDAIPEGSTLWDVGANVGLYSCYAAAARGCRVIAFEPSVFNLELLARNVFLNGLTDRITIVSLPLFERVMESSFNMTTTEWGGALSTFAATHGFDGQEMSRVFEFRTVGMSMDDCVSRLSLPPPQYVKMDVDGIEHLILRGGQEVLKGTRGLQVEINDAFETQAQESQRLLETIGMHFVSKSHSEMIEGSQTFNRTFNQVWAR